MRANTDQSNSLQIVLSMIQVGALTYSYATLPKIKYTLGGTALIVAASLMHDFCKKDQKYSVTKQSIGACMGIMLPILSCFSNAPTQAVILGQSTAITPVIKRNTEGWSFLQAILGQEAYANLAQVIPIAQFLAYLGCTFTFSVVLQKLAPLAAICLFASNEAPKSFLYSCGDNTLLSLKATCKNIINIALYFPKQVLKAIEDYCCKRCKREIQAPPPAAVTR